MEFVFDLMGNMVPYAVFCGTCNDRTKFRAKYRAQLNDQYWETQVNLPT